MNLDLAKLLIQPHITRVSSCAYAKPAVIWQNADILPRCYRSALSSRSMCNLTYFLETLKCFWYKEAPVLGFEESLFCELFLSLWRSLLLSSSCIYFCFLGLFEIESMMRSLLFGLSVVTAVSAQQTAWGQCEYYCIVVSGSLDKLVVVSMFHRDLLVRPVLQHSYESDIEIVPIHPGHGIVLT